MGLKTTNYSSKSLGITFPAAYAILGDLVLNRKTNKVRAIFLIQTSRQGTESFKPIDETHVDFVWDRKTNLVSMAYKVAREYEHYEDVKNKETGEYETVKVPGTLYGWEDDIVDAVNLEGEQQE